MVHAIGAGWSLLLLAATSILGLVLLRREGSRGWRAFRAAAEAGRPPGQQGSDALVGLLGALLLAVPGLISAAAGLLLVTPPIRGLARRGVAARHRAPGVVRGGRRPVRPAPGPRPPRRPDRRAAHPAAGHRPDHRRPARRRHVVEGEVVEGEIVR